MNIPDPIPDVLLKSRLARMASCMERLLTPDFPPDNLRWLIRRALATNDRIQGSELLPITKFRTEDQANAVWERAAIALDERGTGPANVRTDVDAIFEELALNAAQHSQAQDMCYGVVEVDGRRRRRAVRRSDGEILYMIRSIRRWNRDPEFTPTQSFVLEHHQRQGCNSARYRNGRDGYGPAARRGLAPCH